MYFQDSFMLSCSFTAQLIINLDCRFEAYAQILYCQLIGLPDVTIQSWNTTTKGHKLVIKDGKLYQYPVELSLQLKKGSQEDFSENGNNAWAALNFNFEANTKQSLSFFRPRKELGSLPTVDTENGKRHFDRS